MNEYNVPMVSKADYIRAYVNYALSAVKTYPNLIFSLRKLYRNYLSVAYKMKKNAFPISAELRSGTTKEYQHPVEIRYDIAHIPYLDTDVVIIDDIKFLGGVSNGDLIAIFIDREYDILSVKNKVIVDIGANIADSSIYFAKQGAKKVYAFEPNLELYQLARKNIISNSMTDRIELMFAGCSSKSSTSFSPPFLSLEDILKSYSIVPDVLKVDCEGCEYDVIMNTECRLLKLFSGILIEYHYGYKGIVKKLQKCGFKVKTSGPTYMPQIKLPKNAGARFSVDGSELRKDYVTKPFVGYVVAETERY